MRFKYFALLVLILFVATLHAQTKIPFDIHKRPMPEGTDLEKLIPLRVGPFQREPIPENTPFPEFSDVVVTYKLGKDSVSFGFSCPGTPEGAREAVEVTKEEELGKKVLPAEMYSIKKDPGFFKQDKFLSWSRGKYFFYANASHPAVLDAFLRAFPY